MAEYEGVSTKSLKLKGIAEPNIKKKKKKSKTEKLTVEQMRKSNNPVSEADTIVLQEEKRIAIRKTPAQIAFEKMQEKRRMEKILEKASKTHKQRVEEFNRHLDSLTEHYDIPKVSWTK